MAQCWCTDAALVDRFQGFADRRARSQTGCASPEKPLKHNATRRHRIPKMNYKVTNWPDYEAGLRLRGSLTFWVTPEHWPHGRRHDEKPVAASLIPSLLSRRSSHWVACLSFACARAKRELMISLLELMGLDLPIPNHTTLSRRAQTWEPSISGSEIPGMAHSVFTLHLAMDGDGGEIVAHRLTNQDAGDPSHVAPLLDQFTADETCDPTYGTVLQHSVAATIVILPRVIAGGGGAGQREDRIRAIADDGG